MQQITNNVLNTLFRLFPDAKIVISHIPKTELAGSSIDIRVTAKNKEDGKPFEMAKRISTDRLARRFDPANSFEHVLRGVIENVLDW